MTGLSLAARAAFELPDAPEPVARKVARRVRALSSPWPVQEALDAVAPGIRWRDSFGRQRTVERHGLLARPAGAPR